MAGERWPALMSVELAAEYLDMSTRSLKRLQAAERIRPVTIRDGAFLRFRRNDLDDFIDQLPIGSGSCAANEKRIAVLMLAKQQAKQAKHAKRPAAKCPSAAAGKRKKETAKS